MPTIKYSFLVVACYRPGLVVRTFGVVCLLWRADSVFGNPRGRSGLPILLGTYDHPVAPGDGFTYWNRLSDTRPRQPASTRATSGSRPAFTLSCQWRGTGIGLWWATGSAFLSITRRIGGTSIRGRGWWVQMLNVLNL